MSLEWLWYNMGWEWKAGIAFAIVLCIFGIAHWMDNR